MIHKKSLSIWSPRPNSKAETVLSSEITVYGLPVIDIVEQPITKQERDDLLQTEVLIFTSQNSVAHLLSQCKLSDISEKYLIAIGEKTRQTLQKHGLVTSLTAPPPHNSESLLTSETFQMLPFSRFVIVMGVGGKQLLSTQLKLQNKLTKSCICYQRDKINLSSQVMIEFTSKRKIGGVILSSCEITKTVSELLTSQHEQLFNAPAFALSERIAELARHIGFKQVVVSEKANQDNLYQSIINWWEGQLL